MKTIESYEENDSWLNAELAKLLAVHQSRTRSIYIRRGIARKREANKPFQTPARTIALARVNTKNIRRLR